MKHNGDLRGTATKNPILRKKFTEEEDELLKKAVEQNTDNDWYVISQCVPNRTTRQCHDRWALYLSPSINKKPWTEKEESFLMKMVRQYGKQWVTISLLFDGRTETQLKNKYNALLRRVNKKKRNKVKYVEQKQKTLVNKQNTKKQKENRDDKEDNSYDNSFLIDFDASFFEDEPDVLRLFAFSKN